MCPTLFKINTGACQPLRLLAAENEEDASLDLQIMKFSRWVHALPGAP